MPKRKHFSANQKAHKARQILKEEKAINQIASEYGMFLGFPQSNLWCAIERRSFARLTLLDQLDMRFLINECADFDSNLTPFSVSKERFFANP